MCPAIWCKESLLHPAIFLLWFFWLGISSVLFIPVLCYSQAMRESLLPVDWICSMSFQWDSLPGLSLEPSSAPSLLLSPSALTEGGMFGAPVQCCWLEYFILFLIPHLFESYFVVICFSMLAHLIPRIHSPSRGINLWVNSLIVVPIVDLGCGALKWLLANSGNHTRKVDFSVMQNTALCLLLCFWVVEEHKPKWEEKNKRQHIRAFHTLQSVQKHTLLLWDATKVHSKSHVSPLAKSLLRDHRVLGSLW